MIKSIAELRFVRSCMPLPTVEIDVDSLPANGLGYSALMEAALTPVASTDPPLRATIYVYQGPSINFHALGFSAFFAVAGDDDVLLDVIYEAFAAVKGIKVRYSDYIRQTDGLCEYHLEGGRLWRPEEAHMWRAIAQPTATQQQDVSVDITSFDALAGQAHPLRLDHYQRPYVWNADKVRQLVEDLTAFHQEQKQTQYYMGTLLLHRQHDTSSLFVIDGQQRLSSLAVLYHALTGELPDSIDFHYRSPLSATNLKLAQQTIADQPLDFDVSLFKRLYFTVITVDREDLAFTFFDTQNNRGVPLAATDLLKAFHLRAIQQGDTQVQQDCARRWESVQVKRRPAGKSTRDFAPELFGQYLWRARNWRGQKHIERESHDDMLATFQQQSVDNEASNRLPLYPAYANQLASHLSVHGEHDYQLDLPPLQLSQSPARLPFSLRQPIHKGLGFFLYAQKYAALLDELLYQTPSNSGVAELQDFHQVVVKANSAYLQEVFRLAMLMHVDRFGHAGLLPFAQMTEMLLGGLRLEKQYLFREGPIKYLREAKHNLLDVIASAYRPSEVTDFLRCELGDSSGYFAIDKLEADNGVRGRYLTALRSYYAHPARLPPGLPANIARAILNHH